MSRPGSTPNLPQSATEDTATTSLHVQTDDHTTEKAPHKKTGTETVSEETSDTNVMWVDWDGPGDPMNPKK